jgi:hypothetical protein
MGRADFRLWVSLLLRNGTSNTQEVTLRSTLSPGWKQTSEPMVYTLAAHESRPVSLFLMAPKAQKGSCQSLVFNTEAGGHSIGSVTLKVNVVFNDVPQ